MKIKRTFQCLQISGRFSFRCRSKTILPTQHFLKKPLLLSTSCELRLQEAKRSSACKDSNIPTIMFETQHSRGKISLSALSPLHLLLSPLRLSLMLIPINGFGTYVLFLIRYQTRVVLENLCWRLMSGLTWPWTLPRECSRDKRQSVFVSFPTEKALRDWIHHFRTSSVSSTLLTIFFSWSPCKLSPSPGSSNARNFIPQYLMRTLQWIWYICLN